MNHRSAFCSDGPLASDLWSTQHSTSTRANNITRCLDFGFRAENFVLGVYTSVVTYTVYAQRIEFKREQNDDCCGSIYRNYRDILMIPILSVSYRIGVFKFLIWVFRYYIVSYYGKWNIGHFPTILHCWECWLLFDINYNLIEYSATWASLW